MITIAPYAVFEKSEQKHREEHTPQKRIQCFHHNTFKPPSVRQGKIGIYIGQWRYKFYAPYNLATRLSIWRPWIAVPALQQVRPFLM